MKEQILSYELTLPQRIYPHLDRLFSVFKNQVNSYIPKLWNEKGFKLLSQKGSAVGILKKEFPTPEGIPSRVFRNVLELTGQIIRSQIERKEVFEKLLKGEEIKGYSKNFVLNIQRQIENLRKKGREVNSYFSFPYPKFNGQIVITSADDNLEKGQFRRLKISGNFLGFSIKVPTQKGWEWISVKKLIPERLRRALTKAKEVKAVLIKKVLLKSGYSIYRLVIPLSFEVKEPEKVERVLALDLSPSEKRLGTTVLVEGEKVSKPLFFKTQMLRKIERLHFEVSALERKIDNIYNSIENTACKREKERLWERLRHLFVEQKLRQRKIKQIRKEILETFTNLVIAHAKVYDCQAIVIEDLSFKEVPDWKDKKALRRFSQWFYSRFASRLEEKARIYNLKVIKVNPAHTSRVCHKCGKEGKAEGLVFKCFCGKYDRDYNASVNIAFRLTKPKAQGAEGIPGRFPSRLVQVEWKALLSFISFSKLLAWLRIVETSQLKLKKLLKWIYSDKYG